MSARPGFHPGAYNERKRLPGRGIRWHSAVALHGDIMPRSRKVGRVASWLLLAAIIAISITVSACNQKSGSNTTGLAVVTDNPESVGPPIFEDVTKTTGID